MHLDIDRLHATYDIADGAAIATLDRALLQLGDALEEAVEDAGLPDAFAVCVDALSVDVTVDPRRSESNIARAWAATIVASLRDALGSASVVTYPRRVDAILDVVRSVDAGDLRRRWAWRQIGLVGIGTPDAPDVGGLLAAWPADALQIFAVEPAATATMTGAQLVDVARAVEALVGAGSTRASVDVAARTADVDGAMSAREIDPVVARIAPVLDRFDRSGAFSESNADDRRSLVALAVAVVAPALVRSDRLLTELATRLTGDLMRGTSSVDQSLRTDGSTASPAHTAPSVEPPDSVPAIDPREDDGSQADLDRPARLDATDDAGLEATPGVSDVGEDADPAPGSPGSEPVATSFGGLWFLVHAVEALDLVDGVIAAGHRPEQLLAAAFRRATGCGDDPSAPLAAGVDDTDDSALEPVPDDLVDDAAEQLLRWARERLGAAEDDLLDGVWRRPATVLVEPAWIEVTFLLDDVDVDLRRSGLDLDPGFVWWRGAVVRFRYV